MSRATTTRAQDAGVSIKRLRRTIRARFARAERELEGIPDLFRELDNAMQSDAYTLLDRFKAMAREFERDAEDSFEYLGEPAGSDGD